MPPFQPGRGEVRRPESGPDQDRDAFGSQALHLLGVPVTGIGDDDLRQLGDAGGVQFAAGGGEGAFVVQVVW